MARRNATGQAETAANAGISHHGTSIRNVLAYTLDQGIEVDEGERLSFRIVAREGENGIDHCAYRVDLGDDLLPLPEAFSDLEAQFQARERGAEIVRHRRQHLHAVVVEAAQAFLHPEGVDHALEVARPLGWQQRCVAAGAELFDGDRELRSAGL
jgi:hypothetical protein